MIPEDITEVLMKRRTLSVLFLAIVFVTFAVILAHTTALGWDEGSYLMNAQYFRGEGENISSGWPFFTPGFVALAWNITGESIIVGRLISVVFGLLALLVLYKLCEEKFDSPLYPFAVFALAPLFIFWSSQIMTETAAFFFLFSGLYALHKDRHLVAGILMGLTATVRYMFILFGIVVLVNYLINKNKEVWKYTIGGVLGILPFMIYSHIWHRGAFSIILDYVSSDASWSGFLSPAISENIKKFIFLYVPFLPLLSLGWKKSPRIERLFVVVYSLFLLFFVRVSYYRYWLPVMPFIIMIAYRGTNKKKFLAAGLVFLTLSCFIVYDYNQRRGTCRDELYEAHEFLMGKEGAVVSSVHWTITAYRVDRRVFSPWEDYEYMKRYNVTHILTDEELNYTEEASYPECGYKIYRLQEL